MMNRRDWMRSLAAGGAAAVSTRIAQALASGDLETIAKIHNGGPAGAKKSATAKYWAKIKKTK